VGACRAFPSDSPERVRWNTWSWEPSIIVPLALFGAVYFAGIFKMWYGKARAAVRATQIVSFTFGWLSLLIALDSPIHEMGEQLFWVHMTQHEILMVIAAPLLVLSHPVGPMLWALPERMRPAIGAVGRWSAVSTAWAAISAPVVAWILHGITLWIWHAPFLFDATLHNDAVHSAQHISFLGTALLFWWALLEKHGGKLGYGGSILYVFTTAVHTSLLGALLAFSSRAWYAPYYLTASDWHLTALQDQQLGGLVMWIPAGTVMLIVTLVLVVKWMSSSDRRWQYTRTAALLRSSARIANEN
jgi:cytochrome c oxidase assembly factor CtaG